MDSEEAARASAQLKHNRFMAFGKKFRYIEVFQCSGDDMNLVLNGGLHSPANPTKPPLLSPGMLPQTAQAALTQNPSSIPLGIPPPITLSIPPPNHALIAQQQAQFIAQQNLIARQQAAAAAAAVQQPEPQYFIPNLAMIQSSQAAAAAAAAAHQGLAFSQPTYAPQFVFMPRAPMSAQFPPMGLFPNPFHPSLSMASPHQHTPVTATSSMPSMMTNSIKRSYESAFQQDPTTVSAAKRHYATAARQPAPANFYSFYPPAM